MIYQLIPLTPGFPQPRNDGQFIGPFTVQEGGTIYMAALLYKEYSK